MRSNSRFAPIYCGAVSLYPSTVMLSLQIQYRRVLLIPALLTVVNVFTLFFANPAEGAEFCVETSTELEQALQAASFNGEDDKLKLVGGRYVGEFNYTSLRPQSIAILGGYSRGCESRSVSPEETVLGSGSDGLILAMNLVGDGGTGVTLDGLTFQNNQTSKSATLQIEGIGRIAAPILVSNVHFKQASSANTSISIRHGAAEVYIDRNHITNGESGIKISALSATLSDNEVIGVSGSGASVTASAATLSGNVFRDNAGHGVYLNVETATLSDNQFIRNGNTGLFAVAPAISLFNNSFVENNGFYGGGAYLSAERVSVANNGFSANSAFLGGGLYVDSNAVAMANNSFLSNAASHYGGGAYFDMLPVEADHGKVIAAIHNNLFWDNSGLFAADFAVSAAKAGSGEPPLLQLFNNNFDQEPTFGFSVEGATVITRGNFNHIDPGFRDLEKQDLHLKADSPMVDAGSPDLPPESNTDIDGEPRKQGRALDIGADEVSLIDLDMLDPLPEIYANRARSALVITAGTRVSVEVALNAGKQVGVDADWWAALDGPGGWHSYKYPSGEWVLSGKSTADLSVAYQGPLGHLSPLAILDTTDLEPGQYTMYFGVDLDMNGVLDLPDVYYDAVEILVQ